MIQSLSIAVMCLAGAQIVMGIYLLRKGGSMEHERDPVELLEFLLHHRKEFRMSQVQLSVNFTVNNPAPPPLSVTPAAANENLTVGQAADGIPVASVSGGTPPYTYAMDPNSAQLPPGVSFAEDGNGNITLAGTPTAAGTSTAPVLLDITDSAAASVKLKAIIGAK
jgi:hypothetical protein